MQQIASCMETRWAHRCSLNRVVLRRHARLSGMVRAALEWCNWRFCAEARTLSVSSARIPAAYALAAQR